MSTDETLSQTLLLVIAIVILAPFAMFFLMFFSAGGRNLSTASSRVAVRPAQTL